MCNYPELMIIGSDKNLEQCIIQRSKYKELIYNQYLSHSDTYQQISEAEANKIVYNAVNKFFNLVTTVREEKDMKLRKIYFEKSDITYVHQSMKKCQYHSQFYLLTKIHKNTANLPTRPVIGASGSKLFSISIMLDSIL